MKLRRGFLTRCQHLRALAVCLVAASLNPVMAGQNDPTLTPVIIAQAGQVIPGSTIGALASLGEFSVDATGALIADGMTDLAIPLVLADLAATGLDGNTPVPSWGFVSSYGSSLSRSSAGHFGYRALLNGSVDAALLDDVVVLAEGDPIASAGWPSGTTITRIRNVVMNDGHVFVAHADVDSGFEHQGLIRVDVAADGTVFATQALIKSGDTLDGDLVTRSGSEQGSLALNESGQVLFGVELTGAPRERLVLDGVVLLRSGDPSPVLGEVLSICVTCSAQEDRLAVDLDAGGNWVARVQTVGIETKDLILLNGEILAVSHRALPGIPGVVSTFGRPHLGANGNVLFEAESVPSIGAATLADGLFLNDRPLLRSGDVIAGQVIDTVGLPTGSGIGASPYAMDDAGEVVYAKVYFKGGGDWALVRVDIGPWVSLGGGFAGVGVPVPRLAASGPLQGGSTAQLAVLDAAPNSTTTVVIGFSELGAPFKGGVLHPSPDVLLTGLPLDGQGSWSTSAVWPGGIPSGIPLWWQAWTVDPGAPLGLSATNGLRSTTG